MKNFLNYYYNIYPNEIHRNDNYYYMKCKNERYILYLLNESDNNYNDAYNLYLYMFNMNKDVNDIVLNKDNQYISIYNNDRFILQRTYTDFEESININDIIEFNNSIYLNDSTSIKNNWCKKIDFFEYQISQYGIRYPNIRKSIGYFNGMAEIGVNLLNSIKSEKKTICHKRIDYNQKKIELENPLNFIIDYKTRDASEYFKSVIFKKNIDIDIIYNDTIKYLNSEYFDSYELIYFLARLFFPTTFYDYFEKIIINSNNDENIENIINKIPAYEYYVKKIYFYIKKIANIPEIEWFSYFQY